MMMMMMMMMKIDDDDEDDGDDDDDDEDDDDDDNYHYHDYNYTHANNGVQSDIDPDVDDILPAWFHAIQPNPPGLSLEKSTAQKNTSTKNPRNVPWGR